jgi:hypothetical protein
VSDEDAAPEEDDAEPDEQEEAPWWLKLLRGMLGRWINKDEGAVR